VSNKTNKTDRFESLVREACIASYAYDQLCNDSKWTATALLKETCRRGGFTSEELQPLREFLEEKPQLMRSCHAFIRQAVKWFSEGRICAGVPSTPGRMALSSRDDAESELMRYGRGKWNLWML
jgi:hypothetical protein